jgi:hypothetical protein
MTSRTRRRSSRLRPQPRATPTRQVRTRGSRAIPTRLRRSTPTSDRRGRRSGLDPYELAILRGPHSLEGDPEEPDESRPLPKLRFGNLRVGSVGLLVGIFVIFLVGSGVRYGGRNHTPALATSCEKPGLAISVSEVRRGGPLYFAITGPDRTVVIAIDAASITSDLAATPLSGARDTQVDRLRVPMSACKGKGEMGVQVPPGEHTVSVFPAGGGGALASKKLTVTER